MALEVKPVPIGPLSRIRLRLMRVIFNLMMKRMASAPKEHIASLQVRAAGKLEAEYSGLPLEYRIVNKVPGPMLGDPTAVHKPAILYLHGGGFVFPASPKLQVTFLGRLCRDLDAVGFVPDYRLVPHHSAPAALDDCELAYRGLLEQGFAPHRIAIVGESAGGNLVLCLLQRIRKHGLPMPACAVPISPVTELARAHAPPSRGTNAKHDALVSLPFLYRMIKWYVGENDATQPEISPLYADYSGFPPLFFLASEREVLRDDSVLAVKRAREAGVEARLDLWPVLPHAFPIFESMFPEARQARSDIVSFIKTQIERGKSGAVQNRTRFRTRAAGGSGQ